MKVLDIEREIVQRGIPLSWQATYRKAKAGNRPACVKCMCGECQGWEDGARKAIRDCPSVGCPLHAVRPFQTKTGVAEDTDLEAEDSEQGEHEQDDNYRQESQSEPSKLRDLDAARSTVLSVLTVTEWRSKSDILFLSDISSDLWTEIINTLLSQGLVERQGERRSTAYRRKP